MHGFTKRPKWGNHISGLTESTDAAVSGEMVNKTKYQNNNIHETSITLPEYRNIPNITYRGHPPIHVPSACMNIPNSYLGPMQKKLLTFGVIFIIVLIIYIIIAREFIKSYHGCSKSI